MGEKKKKRSQSEYLKKIEGEQIHEVGEDTTKYGEFISSYFAWVPLETQKDKVKRLEQMTKNKNK